MFLQSTHNTFKMLVLITLLCIAAACHHNGQPSNNSTASTPSSGSGDFEGMIAMKMAGEDQKGAEMTYYLKARYTRIETKMGDNPEGQAVMLWDLEGAKITTLCPREKCI
jgi:hypothetical protein